MLAQAIRHFNLAPLIVIHIDRQVQKTVMKTLQSRWTLRVIILTALCVTIAVSFNTAKTFTLTSAAQTSTVPPPPAQRADRFGIYNWNIDYTAYSESSNLDRLNWGAERVAEIGSRTIHAFLGTRDVYHILSPTQTDLVAIAKLPAYDQLFRDPRFKTIMLTTYSHAALFDNWADGFTPTEYAAERDEMQQLVEYLLTNPAFADKTFILFNWEADGAIYGYRTKRTTWDYYRDWLKARVEGVKLAKAHYPDSPVKLFSGMEYVLVRSLDTGAPCGAPVNDPLNHNALQNRCAISYLAPQIEFDYYGYSAWQTLYEKFLDPNADLKAILKRDFTFALNQVKAQRPEVTEHNFILLEAGFERPRYGECNSANYVSELFDAIEAPDTFQVSYAVWWQIVDNAPFFGYIVGDYYFGLYRVYDGQLELTLPGLVFQKRIAGEPVTRYTNCPMIRQTPEPGILTPQGNLDFRLNPDTAPAIYVQDCCTNSTTLFSSADNRVFFDQKTRHFQLTRDQTQSWYESPTQINFGLPPGRRPGAARVFVRDAQGRESNNQTIFFACADCPQIRESCGVLDATYQTSRIEPGDTINLFGERFSPSGNVVTIEQRDWAQRLHTYRATVLAESATQLQVALPRELRPEWVAAVVNVTDTQGRESNDVAFSLSAPCATCPPRIKPCDPILPQDSAGNAFRAGAPLDIFGRFAPSGNSVVVEQTDRNNNFYRHLLSKSPDLSFESSQCLTALLPRTVFPGRAIIYVVDAQGRESVARSITVAPNLVANVSAASFRVAPLAPESIVAAFSTTLATATQSAAGLPLPTELAGTRVLVRDSAGVEHLASLFFVSPEQVNYLLPTDTALGPATVIVQNGYGASANGQIEIKRIAPDLFSASANGRGLIAAVVLRIKADGTQQFEPVTGPIDFGAATDQLYLIAFGTGLRGRSALNSVSLKFGGLDANVTYAGPQGSFAGLDQINALLPRALAGRGEVMVSLTVEGVATNELLINFK
jgi:uncharacterized protein (TIGR03437 family)